MRRETKIKMRKRGAIELLFAQYKKEQWEAKGYDAFIHPGIFPTDKLYEVYAYPKRVNQSNPIILIK